MDFLIYVVGRRIKFLVSFFCVYFGFFLFTHSFLVLLLLLYTALLHLYCCYTILLLALIFILDASDFDLGTLVAVGGLSSIAVGLALQGPATQLLQGALMMAANKFHCREKIRLGDGTEGKVVQIGLLETTIMGKSCCCFD